MGDMCPVWRKHTVSSSNMTNWRQRRAASIVLPGRGCRVRVLDTTRVQRGLVDVVVDHCVGEAILLVSTGSSYTAATGVDVLFLGEDKTMRTITTMTRRMRKGEG